MADTKNIGNHLEAEGEMDYDFVNDILFFKVKNREYNFSLEFNDIVIDIDSEKYITGIQIFDASKFLGIDKANLRSIPKWKFQARLDPEVIEIRLFYQIEVRNRIIEKNPIIIQQNNTGLPSSMTVMAN